MAYFEDLQPCAAIPGEWRSLLAVGWLSKDHPYAKGPADADALERPGSFFYASAPKDLRTCDLCERGRSEAGYLFVPGDGVLYVAPRLLRHYVLRHGYQPPAAFLEAAKNAPAHGAEYDAAIARHLIQFVPPFEAPAPTAQPVQPQGDTEFIRARPGMYIGGTNARGQGEMIWEVIGNSLDEYLAGAATRISIDGDADWVTVEDDGRGFALETIEPAFTQLHFEATLDGHHPHVHLRARQHGVGLAPVCALSTRLEVETQRDGGAYRAVFSRGRVVEPVRRVGPSSKRGTLVRFRPDEGIFDDPVRSVVDQLEPRLEQLAWLCSTLELRSQGRSLQRAEGLPGWVRQLAPDAVKETVLSAVGTENDVDVEVALGWRPRSTEPLIQAFVNYAATEDPESSNRKGLVAAINQFIRQKRASREKKVISGLVAVVHVGLLHPRFGGPTRARLEMKEAQAAVNKVVTRAINAAPWWWDKLHEAVG